MGKKKSTPRHQPTPEPARPAALTPAKFQRLAQPFLRVINAKPATDNARREKLRSLHQLGTLLRKHIPERSIYGEEQFAGFAEAIGHLPSWLHKIWRFPGRYDARDLEELCKTPISWGHVVLLLPLGRFQRRKYQRMAASRGLTVEALRRVLKADFEPLRGGGRQVKIPSNPADALRQLVGDGQVWLQRSRMVHRKIQSKSARKAVQQQAGEATAVLRQMGAVAAALAKELRRKPAAATKPEGP